MDARRIGKRPRRDSDAGSERPELQDEGVESTTTTDKRPRLGQDTSDSESEDHRDHDEDGSDTDHDDDHPSQPEDSDLEVDPRLCTEFTDSSYTKITAEILDVIVEAVTQRFDENRELYDREWGNAFSEAMLQLEFGFRAGDQGPVLHPSAFEQYIERVEGSPDDVSKDMWAYAFYKSWIGEQNLKYERLKIHDQPKCVIKKVNTLNIL